MLQLIQLFYVGTYQLFPGRNKSRSDQYVDVIIAALCAWFQEELSLCKKAAIHQETTMLATSKNVLFPGHNHLQTTNTDDPTL